MVRTDTLGKERFDSLDMIRGVAAMVVAIAHFSYGTISVGPIAGGTAVILFFILSGFVLRHAYGEAIGDGGIKFPAFLAIRIARLYPLHFATFAFVALYWLAMAAGKSAGLPIGVEYDWRPMTIFENLTLTHFWFQGGNSFNAPSWTISIELWCGFYVFFLCLPGVRAVKGLAVLCVIVAYALVLSEGGFMGAEDHYVFGFLEKNYVTGLFYFTLGWAIHHLRSGQRPSRAKGLLGSALAAALFILAAFTDFEVNSARLDELWLFMFCGVVVYFFSFTTMAGTMTTAARLCAESSYGIYLWHVPLMLVMTAFARAIEIKFGYSLMGTHVMDAAFLILLPLIAWGSYRLLELPGKKILRQRLTGKQTSTASATL